MLSSRRSPAGRTTSRGPGRPSARSRRMSRSSLPRGLGDVAAVEAELAAVGLEQPQHAAAERRLPRTRLADQAEGLSGQDREVDAVDRAAYPRRRRRMPRPDREVLGEAARLDAGGTVASPSPLGRCRVVTVARRGRARAWRTHRVEPVGRRLVAASIGSVGAHAVDGVGAAGVEPAAVGHAGPAAGRARDRRELAVADVPLRHRREQPRGVRVLRDGGTGRATVAVSTTWPAYITTHAVAHVGDDAEVVGHEDHRHPGLSPAASAAGRGSAPARSRRARSSARRR